MAETSLHHLQILDNSQVTPKAPERPLTLFLSSNTKCCVPATFSASAHQHVHPQLNSTGSRQGKELCIKPQKIRVLQPLPSRASVPIITYWHPPTVCTPGYGTSPTPELGWDLKIYVQLWCKKWRPSQTEVVLLKRKRHLPRLWNTSSLLGQGEWLSPVNSERLWKWSHSRLTVGSNGQKKNSNTATIIL